MRSLLTLTILLALIAPAQAQCRWNDGSCWYRMAETNFLSLDIDSRLFFQLMLTASGHWDAVPNMSYSNRLHRAIQDFQTNIGQRATGFLTDEQFDQLSRIATPVIDAWGFQSIRHPVRGTLLWVPVGIGLYAERIANGILIQEENNRFRLKYEFFRETVLNDKYNSIFTEMQRSGDRILFHVIRSDFFVIAAHQGRYHRYVRYHRDGSGLIGFDMNWSTEAAPIYGKRLASVISGSLRAAMIGAPYLSVDITKLPWENERIASLPPSNESQAPEHQGSSFGTGFFVSREGHIVTNSHVVAACSDITVSTAKRPRIPARLVAHDAQEDLALIKIEAFSKDLAGIRIRPRLGEAVAVFGYPLTGLLATSGNFTFGNITATAGLEDDPSKLQISAPVQPGNSGGPLLDENGNVIGVVVAKLNAIQTAIATGGDIPQNVNFAVKATVLAGFLSTNNVSFSLGNSTTRLEPADLAEHAQRMSVLIECQ